MKITKVLGAYFRGLKIPVLVLMLMITVSTLLGTIILTCVNSITNYYYYLKDNNLNNAYYVSLSFDEISVESIDSGYIGLDEETTESLKSNPAVYALYPTAVASSFRYDGSRVSIVLYDEKLLDAFPALKEFGIDFSSNPNGIILGSSCFDGYEGDTITLLSIMLDEEPVEFEVAGHLTSSGDINYISFNGGSTSGTTADNLVSTGRVNFMLYSEENVALLKTVSSVSVYMECFLVDFSPDASESEIETMLAELQTYGIVESLDDILENSRESVAYALKQQLPMMLFFMLMALVSYLSMTVLTVKKKEREMAVYYLCGVSRGRCMAIVCTANCIISLIPAVINIIIAVAVPMLADMGYILLDGYMYKSNVYLLILGYFVLTVAVSVITTAASMGRHSPLAFLRGRG